jgi:hypothetical protein
MLGAVPGDPTRNDLSPFCDEIPKDLGILIIDLQFFISAESADLSPQKGFSLPIGCWFFSRFFHPLLLYPIRNNAPLLPPGQRPPGPAAAVGIDFRIIPAGFNPLRQPAATGASTAGACAASARLEFLTGFIF